jgi:hypothetical protein
MISQSERTFVPPVTALRSPPAFPDHGRAFTRDRTLVHRGHSLDHLSITWDKLAGFDQHDLAFAQATGWDDGDHGIASRLKQLGGREVTPGFPQGVGLCLASSLGHGLRKVGEEDGEPEPEGD